MKIQDVSALLLGCLLLGALPACGIADDDDDTAGDDDTADDDDTAGDDDDSASDDDDSAGDDDDTGDAPADEDGDNYTDDVDCNDQDASIHPGADELCDGTDRNCDGDSELGAVDAPTWYEDVDGDGYGLESNSLSACDQPHGYSAYLGDCNDTDPSYHPGATEADCTDPNDYNCDQSVGYADVDGDNEAACEDCNDNDIAVNSAATETCNSVDDDCDGLVDEAGATGETSWYLDADGDGYGRLDWPDTACEQPIGFVDNSDDCDDLDASSYPGNAEVCDGADNNCAGGVDEGVTITFYGDADGDGYGDAAAPISACFLPPGSSANDDDCNDTAASAHPGGIELCDSLDNDCDNAIDENAVDATTSYTDNDLDGYGDPLTGTTSCSPIANSVLNGLDCNDSDVDNHPGNTESCDGSDENCNNLIDETFDADSDGVTTCGADGIAGNSDDDCDDIDPGLFPGNPEICDILDQDCDQVADNGLDVDGDTITPCGADGIAGNADDDCDDTDADNFPENPEVCDAGDNNCDGAIDEGFDVDGDNVTTCGADGVTGTTDDDCDDGESDYFPGATEACDGTDEDCDGETDEDFDVDGDGLTTCGPDGAFGTGDEDCDDAVTGHGQAGTGVAAACAASSCKAIRDAGFATSAELYWLDPGALGAFEASCDMTTESGGWTLVLSYLHQGGSNPALDVRSSDFPLKGSDTLGGDESASQFWGHASNAMMASLNPSELIFYCESTNHSRVIHFKTSSGGVLAYTKTGSGDAAGVYNSSLTTSLALRNNSTLPLHTNGENSFYSSQGNGAMVNFPFYSNSGIGNPRAHWGIRGNGNRWECDDTGSSASASHSLFRVWAR